MITYNEYLSEIGDYRIRFPEQRAGQAAFNVLNTYNHELAMKIQFETNLDPFHLNSDDSYDRLKLKTFFEYVRNNWEHNG